MQIAEREFGEISYRLYVPGYAYLEGAKFLYALSLGSRAIQFLLHAKHNDAKEMPKAPRCPECHFHVAKGHRGKGIGRRFIEHFLTRFSASKDDKVCAQVTACDDIMNMVGELVLVRKRFCALKDSLEDEAVSGAFANLDAVTADLQLLLSTHIYYYPATSALIYSHLLLSTKIYSHLLISSHVYSYPLTSTHIYSHLLTSTHIHSHPLLSTHIHPHLLSSTHIY